MKSLDKIYSGLIQINCVIWAALLFFWIGIAFGTGLVTRDFTLFANTSLWILIVTIVGFIICTIVILACYCQKKTKYTAEKFEKAKQSLTSDFKPAFLQGQITIPKKRGRCEAKIDENGKIICKVTADFEFDADDFEKFLASFSLEEE